MKLRLAISIGVLFSASIFAKGTYFFSQADQNNWQYFIKSEAVPANQLFAFDNGTLKISDASAGYLRTKKIYKNFVLELDWRWTVKAGNSGVLVYTQNDTIWPACFQVQQKADAAGDIICMNGLLAKECKNQLNFTVPKINSSNEKAIGEWNHMKIIARNGELTAYINGVLQNKVTGMNVRKGHIGFQAEGTPMEFKNLVIK